jgi:hypothetical protein
MQKKILILLGLICLSYSMNLSSLVGSEDFEPGDSCPPGQYYKPGCDDCKVFC